METIQVPYLSKENIKPENFFLIEENINKTLEANHLDLKSILFIQVLCCEFFTFAENDRISGGGGGYRGRSQTEDPFAR